MSEVSTQSDLGDKPVTTTSGMTTKVVKGSFWLLAGQVLPLIATFISTPFVIRSLGSEAYGVLILIGLISTYFSFGDLGMSLASTKFGAEAYGKKLYNEEAKIIWTSASIAFCTSLVIAVPLFIFSDFIVGELLKVPHHLHEEASKGLKITSIGFVIICISGTVNTPQLSRLRMDMNTMINAGGRILMILATPVVLYLGGRIPEATIVALAAGLFILLGHLFFSTKLLPSLRQFTISKALVRPLVKFGSGAVLYGIALIVVSNLDKFLLTRLVSVQSLAWYSVAFTFASMTSMFSYAMVQSLIPAFSQLLTPDKKEELKSLFTQTLRISILGLLPSIMFLFVIAKPFFSIWAGDEFGRESVYPYYILLVGVFFSLLVYIPNCVVISHGRPDMMARVYWIEFVPYILMTILLIQKFGIIGAALAWSIKEIINAFIFITQAKKVSQIQFSIISEIVKLGFGIMVLAIPMLFAILFKNFLPWLFVLVPCSLILYVTVAWKGYLTIQEKNWLSTRLANLVKL